MPGGKSRLDGKSRPGRKSKPDRRCDQAAIVVERGRPNKGQHFDQVATWLG
jgi:hypothetical protein